ncbi:MAG: hypothetical protein ACOX0Z_04135 [Candidatus Nanosyncoccaceae bacterium]|jgi:hypothetical protein
MRSAKLALSATNLGSEETQRIWEHRSPLSQDQAAALLQEGVPWDRALVKTLFEIVGGKERPIVAMIIRDPRCLDPSFTNGFKGKKGKSLQQKLSLISIFELSRR